MRVMVLIKATEDSEAGVMPSEDLLTAMTDYNEKLVEAGVMLAGDGLHPSSKAPIWCSPAASARSSTGRSPRPRSCWPATGCGM